MKETINKIFKSPFLQDSVKISVSNIIMYMLPFVVTSILARLYTPEAFGEWGVFSSFVTIVNIGLFMGFENVIIQAKEEELSHIIKLCITISACIISVIAIVFYGGIKGGFPFFTQFPMPLILIVYLFIYATYTIFFNLTNRYKQYYTLAFSNIVQGVSQATFRISLAFATLIAINGLILGTTMALGLTTIFILFFLRKKLLNLCTKKSLTTTKQLFTKYRNFPLYDAPACMLSFAAFNLPVIILSFYFNKAEIGCFSIILQLLLLPMSFVGSAMGKVFYQRISAEHDSIGKTTAEMLKILTIISILPLLFIACGGDKLVVLFLGSQWESAGKVALCLSLWSFPTILTQPLLPIFRVENKQRALLFFDVMYFSFGIGSILLACQITANLYIILITFSIACFIAKSALFLKIVTISGQHLSSYAKISLLWIISLIILSFRLIAI